MSDSVRASIATFPSPVGKRNSYVQIEANKVVSELSQHLLERESICNEVKPSCSH